MHPPPVSPEDRSQHQGNAVVGTAGEVLLEVARDEPGQEEDVDAVVGGGEEVGWEEGHCVRWFFGWY